MKKKLTRALIDEIRKEMPVLSEKESRTTIGGGNIVGIRINGGYLISYDYSDVGGGKFTSYQPDNGGQTIIFDGVTCSYGDINGCAYHLNGIHVGEYPEHNFDIGTMIHEYGHYLQESASAGTVAYAIVAGMGSAGANAYNYLGGNYYDFPTEKSASKAGQNYIDQNYPNSGYKAEGL